MEFLRGIPDWVGDLAGLVVIGILGLLYRLFVRKNHEKVEILWKHYEDNNSEAAKKYEEQIRVLENKLEENEKKEFTEVKNLIKGISSKMEKEVYPAIKEINEVRKETERLKEEFIEQKKQNNDFKENIKEALKVLDNQRSILEKLEKNQKRVA